MVAAIAHTRTMKWGNPELRGLRNSARTMRYLYGNANSGYFTPGT
jgi:hypothetical protein